MAVHRRNGAYVCIWRNGPSLLHSIATSGHAALKLVGPSYERGSRDGVYISWWPEDSAGVIAGTVPGAAKMAAYSDDKFALLSTRAQDRLRTPGAVPRPLQIPLSTDGSPTEWEWIKKPHTKIFIPAATDEAPFGLNLATIEAWWRVFKSADKKTFNFLHRNCSHVVAKALRAGGAHTLARRPPYMAMRPTVIEQWAKRLASRCDKRNGQAKDLAHRAGQGRSPLPAGDTVWSAAEWQKRSGGFLRPRAANADHVGELLVVDEGLRQERTPIAREHRKVVFKKILQAIHEEVFQAGARGHAPLLPLLELGNQCLGALAYLNEMEAAESTQAPHVVYETVERSTLGVLDEIEEEDEDEPSPAPVRPPARPAFLRSAPVAAPMAPTRPSLRRG